MKKTAIALSLLLSACALTACGDSSSSAAPAASSAESSASSAEAGSEADSGESSEASSAADSEASSEAAADAFDRGSVTGQTYSSSFSGLSMTVPETWVFSTEDELLEMMNIAGDGQTAESVKKALVDQVTIYDGMANNPANGTNVIVMYENLAKEVPDVNAVTMKDYLVSFKLQLTSNSGSNYTLIGDETDISLCGETYRKLVYKIDVTASGDTYYQAYYLRKIGNYMNCIISTASNETELNEIEGFFS